MSDPEQLPSDPSQTKGPVRSSDVEAIVPGPAPLPRPKVVPPVSTVARKTSPPESKDGTREIVETIVFVVVLVLLLKTFLAEAFVIPTGSMATTLLGYHKEVTCEKCQYHFQVNASDEVEKRPPETVTEWICPNCRYRTHLKNLPLQEGRGP